MNKLSTDAKKYFKEVKKNLSCSWLKKKVYIDFIKSNISFEFALDSTTTYDDLVQLLGEPKKVADDFNLADKSEIELRSKIFSNTILLAIILIIVIIILIILLIIIYKNLGGSVTIID
ncbi:MAG: hypothetical protein IJB21_01995 [Bacilli bacterium]|nr:hypothetical protein [Bacilli bacterium]